MPRTEPEIEEEPLEESAIFTKDHELRREILSRWKMSKDFYVDWTEQAKEDYAFGLGDQWTKEERDTLEGEGRPAFTFNRIRSILNVVSGYQRENSARIKVNPEGGEDSVFSQVWDRVIKWIDKTGKLNYKLGYQFDDGLYTGKGYLEALINYDNDPVRGELKFNQLSPYQVKIDPECKEYNINEGAEYLFKIVRLNKTKLKELYPKKKKVIGGFVQDVDDIVLNGDGALMDGIGADDDYGNQDSGNYVKLSPGGDASELERDMKFTVREYWRPKLVDRYFVINREDGQPEKFEKKSEAESFAKEQGAKVITRKVKEMWVSAYCAGWILQDEISPFEPFYSGYPIFQFIGDWAPNAESEVLRVQGLVRPVKDCQREKNKAKSQYLHIVNTTANSGWIGDEDALSPEGWKQLEKKGASSGVIVKKKRGTDLQRIPPGQIPATHIAREEKADEEFKQILGINPDLLGQKEKTESGRAISLRIRQAVIALVRLFSNYKYTKEIIGKFMLDMVPMLFDADKVIKIIGPKYMRSTVNEQYPEGLNKGHIEGFLQMVEDNRYDVFITESDQNSTVRFEIFQELSELLQAGAPIPIDMIVDYMDLPNSEEVKKRLQEQQEIQQQLAMAQASQGNKSAAMPGGSNVKRSPSRQGA